MNKWGHKLYDAVLTVAELSAIGFGLSKNFFTDKIF
jgi:hypothetical protein